MTPLVNRLGQNTFWLLLARLGTQGLLVLFTLIIARRLGNIGLGQYAFIASAIFLANTLTTFGTDMFLIREIAAGTGLSQLPATLLIQLALSTICAIVILAGAPLLPNVDAASIQGLLIYSLALFPLAFFTVFTTALRGQERMYWYAVLNLIVSLAQVLALWIFVQPGSSVVAIAWILVAIQTIAALLAGLICVFQIPDFLNAWHFSLRHVPSLLRASAPIALLGLLGMLYLRLSIYQVTLLSGSAVTGWFSAALRIVEAFKTGHLALFGALYPIMSKVARQPTASERLVSKSVGWLLGISVILSLVLFALARPLVRILYGANFAPSIAAAQILSWIIIPYTLNTFLSLSFLAHRREPAVAWALLGSLLTLAVLNLWWVPLFGLAGACWAALVAESIQALILVSQHFLQPHFSLLSKEPEIVA
jgi:O-antigen/teichoic acid export membrane protein